MEELLGGIFGEVILSVLSLIGVLVGEFIWKQSDALKQKIKNEHLHTLYSLVENEVAEGAQAIKAEYKVLAADGEVSAEDRKKLQAKVKEEVMVGVKDLISKLPNFVKHAVFGKAEEEIHKAASKLIEKKVREQKFLDKLPVNLK